MPFGYLEFLHAIKGNHDHTRAGAGAGARSSGLDSGSLPDPVLFEPGLTGIGYSGSRPLCYLDPRSG